MEMPTDCEDLHERPTQMDCFQKHLKRRGRSKLDQLRLAHCILIQHLALGFKSSKNAYEFQCRDFGAGPVPKHKMRNHKIPALALAACQKSCGVVLALKTMKKLFLGTGHVFVLGLKPTFWR